MDKLRQAFLGLAVLAILGLAAQKRPGRSRTSLGLGAPYLSIMFVDNATTPIAAPWSEIMGEPDMPPITGWDGAEIQSGPSFIYSTVHLNHSCSRACL